MKRLRLNNKTFKEERFIIIGKAVFHDVLTSRSNTFCHDAIKKIIVENGGVYASERKDATCLIIGEMEETFENPDEKALKTVTFQNFFHWLKLEKNLEITEDGSIITVENKITFKDITTGIFFLTIGCLIVFLMLKTIMALFFLIAILIGAWIAKNVKQ